GGSSACQYGDDTFGPPACFGRELFARLEQLDGDKGARGLLRGAVALNVPPSELFDVDTAEQLADLNQQSPSW
ncbi:MAG: nucleotidyltransferase family protein, partial [Novosphingobium sp.]